VARRRRKAGERRSKAAGGVQGAVKAALGDSRQANNRTGAVSRDSNVT